MKSFLKYALVLVVGLGVGYGYAGWDKGEMMYEYTKKIEARDSLIESTEKVIEILKEDIGLVEAEKARKELIYEKMLREYETVVDSLNTRISALE